MKLPHRQFRLAKSANRSLRQLNTRWAPHFSKQSLGHAARVFAPTLFALAFASAAHAQGTMDFSGVSVLERSLHFGPRTSITAPLRCNGLGFGLSCSLQFEICQQSRPWECGNPEGISKECGKGGKRLHGFACFPYSVISTT